MKKLYVKMMTPFPDDFVIFMQYLYSHKSIPPFVNPQKFNDKIHHIKTTKWLENKGDFVDKYKVKAYIEKKIGVQYLPKLYDVYQKSTQLKLESLPESFVLKLNNGSGCNLIVKDKSQFSENDIRMVMEKWLNSNQYKKGREKQYKKVEHVVIAEEYLEDSSGELRDYKFFVFNGEVKFVQVDTGRQSEHIQTFYDQAWNKLDFSYACEKNNFFEKEPAKFKEMVSLAEVLGEDFPFVRVDFYYTNDRIYFGELTFTPNNGRIKFSPEEKELEFGSWIDLSKYK